MVREVIIFDTTLRDGEQAPGNTHDRRRRSSAWPASSTPWGGRHRGRISRLQRRRLRKSVREIAEEIRRPVIAALAAAMTGHYLAAEVIRNAERGLAALSCPPPTCTRAQAADEPGDAFEARRAVIRQARGYTDDVDSSPPRTPVAPTSTTSAAVVEMAIAEGADTTNLPETVGLRRCRRNTRPCSAACGNGWRAPTAWYGARTATTIRPARGANSLAVIEAGGGLEPPSRDRGTGRQRRDGGKPRRRGRVRPQLTEFHTGSTAPRSIAPASCSRT